MVNLEAGKLYRCVMVKTGDGIGTYSDPDFSSERCKYIKRLSDNDIVLVVQTKVARHGEQMVRIIHNGSCGWINAKPNEKWWSWKEFTG